MRTKNLIYGLFAALTVMGCSSEENITADNGQNTGSEESHYLYVNILNDGSTTKSRADADYEQGTENDVENVRFYFFNSNGEIANVKKSGTDYVNYCDAENPKDDGSNMDNVEKLVEAVVVLNYASGDQKPAKMVAVVNYKNTKIATDDSYKDKSLSLSTLESIVEDYSATGATIKTDASSSTTTYPFLMTSSEYVDNNTKVVAAELTDANLQQSEALAKQNPVDIYVERVVAKVRFNVSLSNGKLGANTAIYDETNKCYYVKTLKDKSSTSAITTTDNTDLYIKLCGWNVTATTNNSYLFKKVQTTWSTSTDWGASNPWTLPASHRSFWAENPKNATVDLPTFESNSTTVSSKGGYGSYTDAEKKTDFSKSTVTYVQENAGKSSADGATDQPHTKVIIAAKLGTMSDNNFTATSIYEYADQRFTNSENCIKTMLNAFSPNLYRTTTNGETADITADNVGYKKISADDVELVSALKAGVVSTSNYTAKERYKSYLKGKSGVTFYTLTKGTDETYTAAEATNVDETLQTVYANVYKDGYCYYYFDIQHFGYGVTNATFGEYGVVRNHIYECVLDGIYGLGTPVPDETEIIVPEKPTEDVYVAAKINILSWRIVNNKITLEW